MEVVALVGSTLAGSVLSVIWGSMAYVAFVVLVSLLPSYIALYRGCYKRAIGLGWVVLIADVGLVGMPPFGVGLWLCALAYAFVPRRRRVPARLRRPIAV